MKTPICWWPFSSLVAPEGVLVIGIEGDGDRPRARVRIREAIHDALLLLTGSAVTLHGGAGAAPWALQADGQRIGLSISHEGALSIAALNLHGAVGVDMLHTGLPDDALGLTLDYLGPEAAQALTLAAAADRPAVFTAAWTAHEARLKCLGLELGEWHDDARLVACRVLPLALPAGLVGTLALPL